MASTRRNKRIYLGQERPSITQVTRPRSSSGTSDDESSPIIEGATRSGQHSLRHCANNNNNDNNNDDDDDNGSDDHDDFLDGDLLQLLHDQKFNYRQNHKTMPTDAERRGRSRTASDGPRPSRSKKRRSSEAFPSDESERSSNGGVDEEEEDSAAAAELPTNKKARCPPSATNHRTTIPPQRPKRASPRTLRGKAKTTEEPPDEWEKYEGIARFGRGGQHGRNSGRVEATRVVAVSLREMLDSAVEVLLGGVRIYRATGGRSSIGMVFLPPGGAFPPEVVQNSQISFVVLAGKITVEIGCGGGVDSGHRGPPDQKAVYGASQGTIVFLEKGDAFSVKNASRTTAQLVYLLV